MMKFRSRILPFVRALARYFHRPAVLVHEVPVQPPADPMPEAARAVPAPTDPVKPPADPVADPASPSAIVRFAMGLFGPWLRMEPISLSETDRHKRSGALFIGGASLVSSVANALKMHPDLFPDAEKRAAALMRRQGRAAAWLLTKTTLEDLLREASDSYLYEQTTAQEEAMEIVEQVRRRAEDPDAPAEWREPGGLIPMQQLALSGAYTVLEKRQQKKRRTMLRNRRKEGKAPPQRRGSGPKPELDAWESIRRNLARHMRPT